MLLQSAEFLIPSVSLKTHFSLVRLYGPTISKLLYLAMSYIDNWLLLRHSSILHFLRVCQIKEEDVPR
jgi:hypothetical protein